MLRPMLRVHARHQRGGVQDRGESIPEQRAVRGIGACQCSGLRWKKEDARPTGKGSNRVPG
jgi:hypothetical protein